MNKKMMIIIGGAVLGIAITLILIFTLSGNSKRDMIVGGWDFPRAALQFNDDGTVYQIWDPEEKGTWSLGGDEKILTIIKDEQTLEFELSSVSEDELCLTFEGDMKCLRRYTEEGEASDYEYYEEPEEDYYEYYEEPEAEYYDNSCACKDAYGQCYSYSNTCYTCGTTYCNHYNSLDYGKYCSQGCCAAYEGISSICGY